jgi:hypothetical protein
VEELEDLEDAFIWNGMEWNGRFGRSQRALFCTFSALNRAAVALP